MKERKKQKYKLIQKIEVFIEQFCSLWTSLKNNEKNRKEKRSKYISKTKNNKFFPFSSNLLNSFLSEIDWTNTKDSSSVDANDLIKASNIEKKKASIFQKAKKGVAMNKTG